MKSTLCEYRFGSKIAPKQGRARRAADHGDQMLVDDDSEIERELFHQPAWEGCTSCSDGSWDTETSGGGEAIGHYGLLSCRWGIPRENINFSQAQWRFLGYLRRSPCHILCLQEVDEELKIELTGLPNSKFIGIRAPEGYGSLMICARKSVVCGIRLLLFHRTLDGTIRIRKGT